MVFGKRYCRAAIADRLAQTAFAALTAIVLATSSAPAADRVVHVYNWSDYIDENVLDAFTERTGIKVVYDVYDGNDVLETKLLAGTSGYDVVVPTDATMARQIAAGTLMRLDKTKLPNLRHMWPEITELLAAYDPGNQYGVNYMWGTGGIGINVDQVRERLGDQPLDSWGLLFDPEVAGKLADCGIYLLDSPEDVIQSALLALGIDPRSQDPADIERAEQAIRAIRPFVQKFNSSEYISALANGDICVALGYSGDILQAEGRAEEAGNGVSIAYVLPKEGALMWLDNFAIPADAPNPDEAYAFIDFMMEPQIAAANSNHVYYANGNKESQPFLDPELLADPAIYPDEATLSRLHTTGPYPPKLQRMITRFWSDLKAGG